MLLSMILSGILIRLCLNREYIWFDTPAVQRLQNIYENSGLLVRLLSNIYSFIGVFYSHVIHLPGQHRPL